jgi:hypothetical protein
MEFIMTNNTTVSANATYYNSKGVEGPLHAFAVGELVSSSADDGHEGIVSGGGSWEPVGFEWPNDFGKFQILDLINYRGWRLLPGLQVVEDNKAAQLYSHFSDKQYASDRAEILNAKIKAAGGPDWDSL